WNPLTTQIESHDWQAEIYADVARAGRILHNLATDVELHLAGLLPSAAVGPGRHRLLDDAAQGEPDPLRERRGEPRDLRRPAGLARPDARHLAPAARPHGLHHAAQHRARA